MKKLLSLALILALVATLTTSVFAAERVVGHSNNNIDDGVTYDQFGSGTAPETTISISVTAGQVESRYAVDVEFAAITLNVASGKLAWNVNSYQYEKISAESIPNLDTTREIKIINHSDQPVWVTKQVNHDNSDGITITATGADKVERTQANATQANEEIVTVSITATDWEAVAKHYAPQLVDQTSIEIATITLTISKDPV